mmetsp:Transcript_27432/g.44645  ORF Transcript_27432/g.44645 Transcript_27432/m.44645 type:complete len:457 (-) Transcript_27432:410-1780(-)
MIREIADRCNIRNRNAKFASKDSQKLFLHAYLATHGPLRVKAVIYSIKHNGFLAFVPSLQSKVRCKLLTYNDGSSSNGGGGGSTCSSSRLVLKRKSKANDDVTSIIDGGNNDDNGKEEECKADDITSLAQVGEGIILPSSDVGRRAINKHYTTTTTATTTTTTTTTTSTFCGRLSSYKAEIQVKSSRDAQIKSGSNSSRRNVAVAAAESLSINIPELRKEKILKVLDSVTLLVSSGPNPPIYRIPDPVAKLVIKCHFKENNNNDEKHNADDKKRRKRRERKSIKQEEEKKKIRSQIGIAAADMDFASFKDGHKKQLSSDEDNDTTAATPTGAVVSKEEPDLYDILDTAAIINKVVKFGGGGCGAVMSPFQQQQQLHGDDDNDDDKEQQGNAQQTKTKELYLLKKNGDHRHDHHYHHRRRHRHHHHVRECLASRVQWGPRQILDHKDLVRASGILDD